MLTGKGEILAANQPFERIFRLKIESLRGKNLLVFSTTPREKLESFLRNCSRSRQTIIGAMDLQNWQGQITEYRCEGALLEPASESTPAIIFVRFKTKESAGSRFKLLNDQIEKLNREIAERRRAEELNRKLYVEASEAGRLKDDFLATVSHELRTPLNAILGWVRMLRTGTLDEENFTKGLETIERNSLFQSQLIEDLLDVSRIITGKLRLDVRPVNLNAIIENAIDSVRPMVENKDIRLQFISDSDVGAIRGDAERLQQIVWNLLSNAIKFTPRGGSVETRLERVDSHVEITVSDTGSGIAPDFLPFVFERFLQADASKTRKFGGLGLGLAIVRHLTELHGGTAHVFSDGLGTGATFTIKLPTLTVREKETFSGVTKSNQDSSAATSLSVPDFQPAIENLRLLVVDDIADARDLMRVMLEKCDARVEIAASAVEALEKLEREKFDILISDIEMPINDGFFLINKIRNSNAKHIEKIPAVALTAHAGNEDRRRILSAGFNSHVVKPFEPSELISVLARLAASR